MTSKKSVPPKIHLDVTMFSPPQNDVRGVVTAFVPGKKAPVRIAHAYILTGKPAALTCNLPKTPTLEELEHALQVLEAFMAKVRELQ